MPRLKIIALWTLCGSIGCGKTAFHGGGAHATSPNVDAQAASGNALPHVGASTAPAASPSVNHSPNPIISIESPSAVVETSFVPTPTAPTPTATPTPTPTPINATIDPANPAHLVISPIGWNAAFPINVPVEKTFTLTNNFKGGALQLIVIMPNFVFTGNGQTYPFEMFFKGNTAFPGAGGTCGSQLEPGSSCTIVLTVLVPSPSRGTGWLTFRYKDATSMNIQESSIPIEFDVGI